MKILFVNINITAKEVVTAIQTQPSDEQLKPIVFAALAQTPVSDLTQSLKDSPWVAKIEGFAQERAQKITHAVKLLNGLCNKKEDLLEVCPSYIATKEALQNLGNSFFKLSKLDCSMALTAALQVPDAKIKDKLIQEINKQAKCQTSSRISVQNALFTLDDTQSLNDALKQELIKNLYECLKTGFLDRPLNRGDASVEDVKIQLSFNDIELKPETRKIFEEQAQKAKEETGVIRNQKRNELSASLDQGLKAFEVELARYQEAKKVSDSNRDFQKYVERKKSAYAALSELSSFCILREISDHPRIHESARTKLRKIAVVL